MGADSEPTTQQALTTPRAAGVAGVLFALLLAAVIVLVRAAVPADPGSAGLWLTEPWRREAVQAALDLVPFAGIFFLWFMAAVRDRIGAAEDRFFATVFLGSGLLFAATLLGAAAAAGGLLEAGRTTGGAVALDLWRYGHHITYRLLTEYAMRMAAVFTACTSTISRQTGFLPHGLTRAGYLVAVVLIVAVGAVPWVELVFPAWALVVALYILIMGFRSPPHPR